MTPDLRLTRLSTGSAPNAPLLVLGPALGTSSGHVWAPALRAMPAPVETVGWELPGHAGAPSARGPLTAADLADALAERLPELVGRRRGAVLAGAELGAQAVLELLAAGTSPVVGVLAVGACLRLPDARQQAERAEFAGRAGTPSQIIESAGAWFAPGFIEREAATGQGLTTSLLRDLQFADQASYAACGSALAHAELADRLPALHRAAESVPVRLLHGAQDPRAGACAELAAALPQAESSALERTGRLVPVERPQETARALHELASST